MEEKILKLLNEGSWRFAKTMKQHPHEYTLKENWNKEDFIKCVKYIRKFGVWGNFFKVPIKYFYTKEYKYWTMGYGLDQTKLINRAKI